MFNLKPKFCLIKLPAKPFVTTFKLSFLFNFRENVGNFVKNSKKSTKHYVTISYVTSTANSIPVQMNESER